MSVDLYLKEAINCIQSKKTSEASLIIDKALEENPDNEKLIHLKGYIANLLGNFNESIKLLSQATLLKPNFKEAWVDLGLAQKLKKDYKSAQNSFKKAINIGEDFISLVNYADLLFETEQYEEAVAIYLKTLNYNDNDHSVYYFLGICLYKLKRYVDSIKVMNLALSKNNNLREMNYIIALCLNKMGKDIKAIEFYKRELELNPENYEAMISYGNSLRLLGYTDKALEFYGKGVRHLKKTSHYNYLIFIMQHDLKSTDKDLLELAQEYYEKVLVPKKNKVKLPTLKNTKKPKIRLGFISTHFHRKSPEYAAQEIFKNLDRDSFEIYLYDIQTGDIADEITDFYKDLSNKWTDLSDKDLQESIDIIAKDEVDILVDLVGFVPGNRMEIFAAKPAPVQVSWLHYFGTTGLKEMDWVIANENAIPKTQEQYYSEKVYRIDGAYVPHKAKVTDIEVKTEAPCTKNDYISFGSFNRYSKLNPTVLALWGKVLQEVPNSKLIMFSENTNDPDLQEHVKITFENCGITRDRIEIRKYPDVRGFYESFNDIDIHLDPFPYNGGTTTFDSLWMGTPIVSLCGERWSHRFGEIICKEAGCPEFISYSFEEYIQKAKNLASKPDSIVEYKKTLRDKFKNSGFFNYSKLTQDLNLAFKTIYQEYLDKLDA